MIVINGVKLVAIRESVAACRTDSAIRLARAGFAYALLVHHDNRPTLDRPQSGHEARPKIAFVSTYGFGVGACNPAYA